MDRYGPPRDGIPATFVASVPRNASAATTPPERSFGTFVAALPRLFRTGATDFRRHEYAFALLIVTAIGLVVVPDLITYLTVEHEPILPPGRPPPQRIFRSPNLPVWADRRSCCAEHRCRLHAWLPEPRYHRCPPAAARGEPALSREPETPPVVDFPKIVLANVFILALWKVGHPSRG